MSWDFEFDQESTFDYGFDNVEDIFFGDDNDKQNEERSEAQKRVQEEMELVRLLNNETLKADNPTDADKLTIGIVVQTMNNLSDDRFRFIVQYDAVTWYSAVHFAEIADNEEFWNKLARNHPY